MATRKALTYCSKCLLPNSKPDLTFDEQGVCNACTNYEDRSHVDWSAREKEFLDIVERYRSQNASTWDCIVPVSGGKDSTYQVLKLIELGVNPLCVTSTTCDLSEIGRANIQTLKVSASTMLSTHRTRSSEPNLTASAWKPWATSRGLSMSVSSRSRSARRCITRYH